MQPDCANQCHRDETSWPTVTHSVVSASLYTTFRAMCTPLVLATAKRMCEGCPTREAATYSWPCAKHWLRKNTPIRPSVCPCALLMVMAKDTRTGNCCRDHLNGNSPSGALRRIRGILTMLPACAPVRICAYRTRKSFTSRTSRRVPLQSPLGYCGAGLFFFFQTRNGSACVIQTPNN